MRCCLNEILNPQSSEPYIYYKSGNTAVFSFDGFDCDYTDWENFYKGGKRPDDLVTGIYNSLVDADSDTEIKNFLFDLSANTGGVDMIVFFIMSEIAGQSEFAQEWLLSKTNAYLNVLADRNLDGVCDEKDKDVSFDLNFGMLCSGLSFSCGNYLPSLMKDDGFLVLGETSGGGSCVVKFHLTAEGLPYGMSSSLRMINSKGENIDQGIEPHISLVKTGADGREDYYDMYDLEKISAAFKEFYGSDADDSSEPESSEPESSEPETSEPESKPADKGTNPDTGAAIPAALAAAVVILCAAAAIRRRKD